MTHQERHKYPCITDSINNGGLNMEYIADMKVSAVAFDERGAIWRGKKEYNSIEALLDDAEQHQAMYSVEKIP